jgi:8-hydroxy-5-deazaflavin:NADPH oxidoreductase
MGYRTYISMNIAIIGVGKTAERYAAGFAAAGHDVFMAWKEHETNPRNPILEAFDNVHFCSIEEAAEMSDLVIIATPAGDVREVSYWLGDVRRKVIIDATSNEHSDHEHIKTVCAIRAITGSSHIVKVFNTHGYEQLIRPLFHASKIGMILVGDSKKAKEISKILAIDLGIKDCYDFGGDETIPLFNEMTRCWRSLYQAQHNTQDYKTA